MKYKIMSRFGIGLPASEVLTIATVATEKTAFWAALR
jgi:hypothetical protein